MKILSIDVGIKNLALCIIQTINDFPFYKIEYWEVLNLCNEEKMECCGISNKCPCKKPAKFIKDDKLYCKQHASKTDFKLPTSDLNKYKRLKLDELIKLANEYNIERIKPDNKINLVKYIEKYIDENVLKNIGTLKCNQYNLIDVGKIIKKKLEEEEDQKKIDIKNIEIILIENQISPIANRMAIIQGMLTQYFLMKNKKKISYISGTNKLKLFIGNKKTTYNQRKKLSIDITNNLLNEEKEIGLNCIINIKKEMI